MDGFGMVERLALLCEAQRGHRTITLLLSPWVALTPEVCQEVCGSPDRDVFRQFVQQDLGPDGRIELLARAFQRQPPSGYQALARLVKAGYFETIVTCSPDAYLEDCLREIGCQPRVLVVGVHSHEHIAGVLATIPVGPCIIKLYGGVQEGFLTPAFPDLDRLPGPLVDILRLYLNRQLMVVGSLASEYTIGRLLLANHQRDLFYILPEPPDTHDAVRQTILARGLSLTASLLTDDQGEFNAFFHALAARLSINPPLNTPQLSARATVSTTDVLLVTVTGVETQAVLDLFPQAVVRHYPTQTYYDLGQIEGARIHLVQQPKMGSDEAGGSTLTIYKGIRDLAPVTVIMVGIAFGFDREKWRIGDILVSEQLQLYGNQRVSNGEQNQPLIHLRNARPAVSPRLLSRFKSSAQHWPGQRVGFGLILSGNHLIDNLIHREQIRAFAPEALGGEMEGAGLFAACQDHAHPVDWLLVKAISDWADGEKGLEKAANQLKAARNAAQFVFYVLLQGGLGKER